jgi:hypothetical protein
METTIYTFVCENESGKETRTQIHPLKGSIYINCTQRERRDLLLPSQGGFWGRKCLFAKGLKEFRLSRVRHLKPTTHSYLVPRLRMMELYLHSPYIFMKWC